MAPRATKLPVTEKPAPPMKVVKKAKTVSRIVASSTVASKAIKESPAVVEKPVDTNPANSNTFCHCQQSHHPPCYVLADNTGQAWDMGL